MRNNNDKNTIRVLYTITGLLMVIILMLISALLIVGHTKPIESPIESPIVPPTETPTAQPDTLADIYDTVWASILRADIMQPEWVMAQSVLESGHYKSKYTKTNNNIFGFQLSGVNMTFPSLDSCISYYKKWQLERYKPQNHKGYADFLNRMPCPTDNGIYYARYAADTNYTDKVSDVICWLDKNNHIN